MEKEICGIKEVAKYLNISESGVRKLVREKKIPHFRLNSAIRFDINTINKWVEKLEEKEEKTMLFY